jgi:beta-lactam-binding protein with PASTA domain
MAYTDGQITELKAIEGLNFDKAQTFADKHGLKVRSVIAKARALDIPYQSKVPGQKKASAANVRRKSDIAKAITELLDIVVPSLDKLTLKDLEIVEARLEELLIKED